MSVLREREVEGWGMTDFGSNCSGIEAASVAFGPLGWRAAWFAEIEPFPCRLLAHHYPDVPNLGDMTAIASAIRAGTVRAPDVICGTSHPPAVAFHPTQDPIHSSEVCHALGANANANATAATMQGMAVRRLTPRECERLQGFPDDYTLIPGKQADGPRYKALGNSWAVPVVAWIGRRIDAQLRSLKQRAAA